MLRLVYIVYILETRRVTEDLFKRLRWPMNIFLSLKSHAELFYLVTLYQIFFHNKMIANFNFKEMKFHAGRVQSTYFPIILVVASCKENGLFIV